MIVGRPDPIALSTFALLAAWLGAALLVAAVVAPAAFAVLPTRTLAGALVGRVLPVLFWSGIALGLSVALLGRRIETGLLGTGAAVVLAGACVAAQLVVARHLGSRSTA